MLEPMAHFHQCAAVLSVGDELVLGQTLDTNSRWISDQLLSLGILPVEHVTVPDDLGAQTEAFRRLASGVDLVICSGGLGPTADDLTRQALTSFTGDELVEDQLAVAQIEAWFAVRGRPLNAINRVQALRPSRGICLENRYGTAPGLHVRSDAGGRTVDVFCLPGPPKELAPMFAAAVVPRLRPMPGRTVRTRALHTIGLGESEIALRFRDAATGDLMSRDRELLVGTTASAGIVSCRLRYDGSLSPENAEARLDEAEREIRRLLGVHVFGAQGTTLPDAVVAALRDRGESVATVESCTGGLLAGMLTSVPGSSGVFSSGWVTYSNKAKQSEMGVPAALFAEAGGPGAVSREVASAMATGGLARSGATHCLAITGIAGPDGGSQSKPVGTVWVALASAGGQPDVRRFAMLGMDRAGVRDLAAKAALGMLWVHLAGEPATRLLRQVE
jgi:nicotinamide-nucleotide amidase